MPPGGGGGGGGGGGRGPVNGVECSVYNKTTSYIRS